MNSSSFYRKFFSPPATADKLKLFQRLFEENEVETNLMLALLKTIHRELANKRSSEQSIYKHYAEVIETLRYHKAEMLHQIVDAWNEDRTPQNPEWMSDGLIK